MKKCPKESLKFSLHLGVWSLAHPVSSDSKWNIISPSCWLCSAGQLVNFSVFGVPPLSFLAYYPDSTYHPLTYYESYCIL